MAGIQDMAGGVLIAIGAFFYVVGALGIYRMPDVFTRMHAAGISDTMGAGLLLAGMMFLAGFSLVTVKLAIILGIILFTSPIATHALAQAVLHEGIVPMGVEDELLLGPGAHPGSEKIGRPASKAAESAAKRSVRKTVKRTRKAGTAKRRKRS